MAILDAFGRPIKTPAKADLIEELAGPSMGSVRSIQTSHPADGLTPARLGMILKEAETGDATAYLELAEQMEEKDLHYAGVLGVRKRAIRGLDLVVEAGAEDAASEDAAALVRNTLKQPEVSLSLIDMLDGLGKGYSVHEIIWDVRTSPWKIGRIKYRDPRWFRFDPIDGETLRMRGTAGDEDLPVFRFIDHRPKLKSGLPIRGGLARLAAWSYIFKNYSIKDWVIFLEAYGHPLRIGKYGPGATAVDKATLLRAVRRLGVDMAAIVPKSMEVDIVDAAVTNGDAMFENAARFWDEQVSKGVLGQVSTTDAIAGGHAVGKVHNDVRDDIRDADAEQLAATLMRDVAAPLTHLNFAGATCPQIRFEAPEEHEPRLVMGAIKMFGPLGVPVPVSLVRETFGIREPEEGEAVVDFAAARATPRPGQPERIETAARLDGPRPDSLTEMINELMATGAEGATDPLLGGLIEALATAQTFDEVRDILDQIATDEPDDVLQDLVARLLFASRVAGETGADIGGVQ